LIISSAIAMSAFGPVSAFGDDIGQLDALIKIRQDRWSVDDARRGREEGEIVPALRVISAVRERYPGAEVLDAEVVEDNPPQYVIKIRTRDGRRVDVIADAQTGRILYER
jgi:uncharacterized membrane protein YkoI